MSIRLIVTRGYGNGTFSGTIKDVVTRGYTIGPALILPASRRRRITVFSRKVKRIKGRTALRFSKRSTLKV